MELRNARRRWAWAVLGGVAITTTAVVWSSRQTTPAPQAVASTSASSADEPAEARVEPTLPSTPTTESPQPARTVSVPAPTATTVGRAVPASTPPPVTLPYDPARYFPVSYEGAPYLCDDDALVGFQQAPCKKYYGGPAPLMLNPDLYCEGSPSRPACSELWYLSELSDFDLVDYDGSTHLCRTAYGPGSGIGDQDCARYDGGDPDRADWFSAVKCSPTLGTIECGEKYYPSEIKDITFVKIGFQDYACKKDIVGGYGAMKCVTYSGGSPRNLSFFLPGLYCNDVGCSPDGYLRR